MSAIRNIWIVFKREISSHFSSMLAYVFIAIFVGLSTSLAFLFGRFFQTQEASLENSFFVFHPWLFMILGPAIGMRLWADEHRLGTIELLLTMPVKAWHAITGKYLASCAVVALALVMTFLMVVMVGRLGEPDYGIIWASYLGSFLVGASCLAITCAVSAFTRSLVACLVISVSICFGLVVLGIPDTVRFLAQNVGNTLAEAARSLSITGNYFDIVSGMIRLKALIFYASLIGFCLFLTSVVIRTKRS
jgi:ABC-2 type transport system permease protein